MLNIMISGKLFVVFVLTYMSANMATPVPGEKNPLKPYLNKKYELVSSDANFEEVMKALGVGFLKRKLAHLATPVVELTEKDGEYTFTSESTFKNVITKFRLGEEFEEVTPDDRIVKTVITQEGNKLIQVQKGEKTTVVTREFGPDEVKVTVEVDGITSIRVYKAT